MMTQLIKKAVLPSVFLFFVCVSLASAAEFKGKGVKLWDGPAKVNVNLSTEEQYDDNVFLQPKGGRKSAFINQSTPEFLLTVPLGPDQRHQADLSYSAVIGSFSNFSSNNYVNQTFNAGAQFNFANSYLSARNTYRDTTDRAGTAFTSYVRRTDNTTDVTAGVELNRVGLEFGYEHFLTDYRKSAYSDLDHDDNVYKGTFFYQLQPKTKALLEYSYSQISYDNVNDRDGHYNQVVGGLKWDMTGKTTGIAKFGWQGRKYDNTDSPDFNGFVSEVGFTTQCSAKTRLDANYIRSAEESTFGSSSYVDRNVLKATVTQGIWNKLSAFGGVGYGRDKYSVDDATAGKKRADDVLTVDTGLVYSLQKWLDFKIAYQYAHDGSNIDAYTYYRDLTSVSVTGYF